MEAEMYLGYAEKIKNYLKNNGKDRAVPMVDKIAEFLLESKEDDGFYREVESVYRRIAEMAGSNSQNAGFVAATVLTTAGAIRYAEKAGEYFMRDKEKFMASVYNARYLLDMTKMALAKDDKEKIELLFNASVKAYNRF